MKKIIVSKKVSGLTSLLSLSRIGMLFNTLRAQVAQLVEQWTENPCVVGSIPTGGTKQINPPL